MTLLDRQSVFCVERAYVAECYLEPLGVLRDRCGGKFSYTCRCMDNNLPHLSIVLRALGSQNLFSDPAVTSRVALSLSAEERAVAVKFAMYLKFRRPADRRSPTLYDYDFAHLDGDRFGLSRGSFPQT